MDVLDWILHTGQRYPDVVAIITGTFAGFVFALLAERYWIPDVWPRRAQQGTTRAVNIVTGWVLSFLMWGYLDPVDSAGMREVVSIAPAIISALLYPSIAAYLTDKWPALGSIWAEPK